MYSFIYLFILECILELTWINLDMELTDVLINIFSSILNNILQSLKYTIVNLI